MSILRLAIVLLSLYYMEVEIVNVCRIADLFVVGFADFNGVPIEWSMATVVGPRGNSGIWCKKLCEAGGWAPGLGSRTGCGGNTQETSGAS
jgi:hypothetical protein